MRTILSACLAGALSLVAGLGSASENVSSFTLENGLRLVVIEDHRAAAVTHMVWYNVGAADEAPGEGGVAHYLEHLLFQGTDDLAPGEFSRIVRANGGSGNAFTSWDYTGYFQRVASDRLGLMMQMEADRMRDLTLSEAELAPELQVILEERSQRVDNDPGAIFGEQRRAALYLNHPYGRPIIGWRHEMEQLDQDTVRAFYDLHYAPNNAIVVVAGDVTPEEALTLAQEHYGPLAPSENLPERLRPQEPPHLAERRVTYADPRVATPYVMRTYLAQERETGAQAEAAALTILAELLGGSGATSVMGRKLVFEAQTALYTGAFYSGKSLDDTSFGMIVVPAAGQTLEQAEADMDRVIAEFLDEGVDPEHFARIKMQIRAGQIYERDSVDSVARDYGSALTSGLTIQDVQDWPKVLAAVTPEDVMQAARKVFDRKNSVTGYLMKEGS